MKKSKQIRRTKITKSIIQEPTNIDPDKINTSLIEILSWYRNQNYTVDIQKQWLVDAANRLEIDNADMIYKVPETYVIDTNAYVARMLCNDVNLLEHIINNLVTKIKYYIQKGKESTESKEPRIAPIEKVKETAAIMAETIIEYMEEDSFDIVDYVVRNCLGISYVKQLIKHLDSEKHKKGIEQLNNWIDSNKKERKPRKKKVKSDEDICKLFKCCVESEGLKSVNPVEILGSSCVVVYHTQKKNITFYFGKKLGIHRSMITDFDKKKSKQFEVKKETLKDLNKSGKITIDKIYNESYSNVKEFENPTGRVTDKMIILGKY